MQANKSAGVNEVLKNSNDEYGSSYEYNSLEYEIFPPPLQVGQLIVQPPKNPQVSRSISKVKRVNKVIGFEPHLMGAKTIRDHIN